MLRKRDARSDQMHRRLTTRTTAHTSRASAVSSSRPVRVRFSCLTRWWWTRPVANSAGMATRSGPVRQRFRGVTLSGDRRVVLSGSDCSRVRAGAEGDGALSASTPEVLWVICLHAVPCQGCRWNAATSM